jgi:hypothetical protein
MMWGMTEKAGEEAKISVQLEEWLHSDIAGTGLGIGVLGVVVVIGLGKAITKLF